MDSSDSKSGYRTPDQLQLEILDRLETYKTMAEVFFRRLEHKEKIDALTEVAELIKGPKKND